MFENIKKYKIIMHTLLIKMFNNQNKLKLLKNELKLFNSDLKLIRDFI